MTRRARKGREAPRTYRRAFVPVTATALLALASFAGGCSQLPDDDGLKNGTSEPTGGRRPKSDDEVTRTTFDVCKDRAKAGKQGTAGTSKVLLNNDFETPHSTPKGDCTPYLDGKSGINNLFGSNTFKYAQAESIEAVIIKDPDHVYTDPKNFGGKYAIGMLSDVQPDLLALTFDNDMPYVNVGLFLSPIAIRNCGPAVPITRAKLKVDLYDGPLTDADLKVAAEKGTSLGKLLATRTVESAELGDDAWSFNWRPTIVSLDASKASSGTVSVVFDLLEGGYAAIDNLSVISSTEMNVADLDNNGVPDDVQCSGENAAGGGMGGQGAEPTATRDAGTAARDAGSPADAGAPVATPPAATPTAPAMPTPPTMPTPPAMTTPTAPKPPTTTRDAGTRSSSDDDESEGDNEDDGRDGNPFTGIIDAIRDAGLGRSRGR